MTYLPRDMNKQWWDYKRITFAGDTVEVVWECQFDKDILPRHPELKQHPIIQHAPLNTRDFLYGIEPKIWFFNTPYAKERRFSITI